MTLSIFIVLYATVIGTIGYIFHIAILWLLKRPYKEMITWEYLVDKLCGTE